MDLPAGFAYADDLATTGQLAEADTTHFKAAKIAMTTTAEAAAIDLTNHVLWLAACSECGEHLSFCFCGFDYFRCFGHAGE